MKGIMSGKRLVVLFLLVLVLALAGSLVLAQTGPPDLPRWVVAGGGGVSDDGSGLALTGTIGQAGSSYSSGGDFALQGGFWAAPPRGGTTKVYLPVIVRH